MPSPKSTARSVNSFISTCSGTNGWCLVRVLSTVFTVLESLMKNPINNPGNRISPRCTLACAEGCLQAQCGSNQPGSCVPLYNQTSHFGLKRLQTTKGASYVFKPIQLPRLRQLGRIPLSSPHLPGEILSAV